MCLSGTFGFIKGSFVDGSGSNLAISTGASSITEVPVLIKTASSVYFASESQSPAMIGQYCGDKRTFLNEIAIAAQLSYDCNVLKLCGIIRKGN